jgi:uncharacterized protein (TIGR02147 family)
LEKKSLFEYDNYRLFLRDFYEASRSKNKKFSFRFFSRLAGFKSSGSILKVMNGQTNLSVESVKKLAVALKLNKEESDFFESLVGFNQAASAQERQLYAQKLLKSQTYRRLKPLSSASFKFFSEWYYSPIRELVNLPNFKADAGWIVAKLIGRISLAEARNALVELESLGLIARDSNGKLVTTNNHITSGDEVSFSGAANCHRQFLQLASESIDQVAREKRDLSAMTLGISAEMALKIKTLVQEFRKEIVEVISGDTGSEIVYQLNMQFFPLTNDSKGRTEKV